MLRIAIQKSGRLNEDSVQLFKECGLKFATADKKLFAKADNFPVEFLYLRDDDIPGYVEDGVADIGIIGENVHYEKKKSVDVVHQLGFAKCRLSLAVPKTYNYTGLQDLAGKRIATTYPQILGDFLKSKNIEADIHEISGSVEIAPGIGLADFICDLVSSGSTLLSNGLKEAEVILKSEAILIGNRSISPEKKTILDSLLFRMNAVSKASDHKYILLNVPNDAIDRVTALLPGVKSPSILPLAKAGWSSLHSVVNENQFWDIIEKLRAAGAEGILVVPIEKMIS